MTGIIPGPPPPRGNGPVPASRYLIQTPPGSRRPRLEDTASLAGCEGGAEEVGGQTPDVVRAPGARYSLGMRIASGKVVSGKVVVDGEPLAEGVTVTVLAPDDDETFDLTPEEESLLLASIREAEQGRVVEASVVLRDLGRR